MLGVEALAAQEYARASEMYGKINNSDHESYAILLEEVDEASEEFQRITSAMQALWICIKSDMSNDDKAKRLALIYRAASYGACELIQVVAMAHKALQTIDERLL